MINLIKSEVLKIRSTQVWFWMLVLGRGDHLAWPPWARALTVDSNTPTDQVNYFYGLVTATSAVAGVALLVLGILGLTTEFRHKTITPTLLANPGRWQLLSGQGAGLRPVRDPLRDRLPGGQSVTAIICLNAKGIPVHFTDGSGAGHAHGNFIALILLAFFGLGLGALIRNQAAGMVVGILYLSVLNIFFAGIPWIRKVYLFEPAGAMNAFTSRDRDNYGLSSDVVHVSPLGRRPDPAGLVRRRPGRRRLPEPEPRHQLVRPPCEQPHRAIGAARPDKPAVAGP